MHWYYLITRMCASVFGNGGGGIGDEEQWKRVCCMSDNDVSCFYWILSISIPSICVFFFSSLLVVYFVSSCIGFIPSTFICFFRRLLFVVAFVREGSRVLCALFFGNWSQCKHLAIPSALMLRALWRSIWFGNCSTTNVSGSIDTNWPRRIRVFAWTLWLCKWNSAFRPKRQQLLEFTANKWQQHQFRRKIGTDGTHEVHVHNGRHPERH